MSISSSSPGDSPPSGHAAVRHWGLLLLVMALAAVLRLYALDLIDLRYDEASGARFGMRVAAGEWFAALPNTGSVANHPPVYAYVMALPYMVTHDFIAIAAYRALIDVLAVALCFWMCARHFNRRVAFIAALLFAVAPWAVLFSRNLGVLPPPVFPTLLLFGLLEVTRRRNPWGWAMAGWGLALTLGSHWSAIYLAPVVIVAGLLCFRSLRVWPALVGLAPCLIIGGAYGWFDASAGFANLRGLLGAAGSDAVVNLDALWRAIWLSGGMHLSDLTGPAYGQWRDWMPQALEFIDWAQVGVLVAGVVWLAAQAMRGVRASRPARPAQSTVQRAPGTDWTWLVLLLWWLIPIALQLRHSQHVQMHYLLSLYPAPFVIMALVIDAILSRLSSRASQRSGLLMRLAAGAGLAVILVWQCFSYVQLMAFVGSNDTSAGGYGLPARNGLAVAHRAKDALCVSDACSGPRDVMVATPGGDPTVNEQAAIWDVLLADAPHRFANSDAGLILRRDAAQYVFTPGSDAAFERMGDLLDLDLSATNATTLPIRAGSDSTYTTLRIDTGAGAVAPPAQLARWDNGVSLLAYQADLAPDKASLRVNLFLGVERPAPAGADVHWFNHLLVGDQKIAQLDGGGIHPANWRAGDVLWHWFDIALPPSLPKGQASLRIGSYWYPQIQNVPVLLSDGSISDGINIPIKLQP